MNEPENATVIASSTATEPSGRTVAWTSLETSSYVWALCDPGERERGDDVAASASAL